MLTNLAADEAALCPLHRRVGLDLGKKKLMWPPWSTKTGGSLKYTARQRNFESKRRRYRNMLNKEKKSARIKALQTKLSEFSYRTNCPGEFLLYLTAKREVGKLLQARELEELEFRTFCNRKSGS